MMPDPTPEEREEARNIWPSCYGVWPFSEIIPHGLTSSVTSRCCDFHDKLAHALAARRPAVPVHLECAQECQLAKERSKRSTAADVEAALRAALRAVPLKWVDKINPRHSGPVPDYPAMARAVAALVEGKS